MNQTINLPTLIAQIAAQTGVSPAEVRRFLHELLGGIEQGMAAGESVTLDGIGMLLRGETPNQSVLFRPDEALAALLNEPFAAFEAVELNKGAESEMAAVESAPEPMAEAVEEDVHKDTDEPATIPTEQSEQTSLIIEEPIAEEEPETSAAPETTEEVPATLSIDPVEEDVETSRPEPQPSSEPSKTLWFVLGLLLGLLIGLCGGYFAGKAMGGYELPEDFEYPDTTTIAEEEVATNQPQAEVTETIGTIEASNNEAEPSTTSDVTSSAPAQQPSQPEEPKAAQPVYDTVTQSRYLAIIAKEHYGVKNYWIFIYEANPNLGNPNKIAPGTRVLIPAKETFAEATPEATAAKASRKMTELQKKYKF